MPNLNSREICPKAFAQDLRTRFRGSLTNLGFSPSTHVHQIDFSHISFLSSKKDIRFLNAVLAFWKELDPLQQELFIREFLEKGRYFSQWWRYYFDDADYRSEVRSIGMLAYHRLGGYINGKA